MDTALDKAIKEILCPVVEKSVGTAIQNTKKLILKVTFLTCVKKELLLLMELLISC
jgi:hypothetical protein